MPNVSINENKSMKQYESIVGIVALDWVWNTWSNKLLNRICDLPLHSVKCLIIKCMNIHVFHLKCVINSNFILVCDLLRDYWSNRTKSILPGSENIFTRRIQHTIIKICSDVIVRDVRVEVHVHWVKERILFADECRRNSRWRRRVPWSIIERRLLVRVSRAESRHGSRPVDEYTTLDQESPDNRPLSK